MAFLVLLLDQWVCAVRWGVLLERKDVTQRFLFRLYLISIFFSLFLPSSIGGDAVRIVAVARETKRSGEAVASVALDRISGLFATGVLLIVGALLLPELLQDLTGDIHWTLPPHLIALGGLGGLALGGLTYRFRERLGRFLSPLQGAILLVRRLSRDPGRLGLVVLLALLIQALFVGVWVILAWGIGIRVPFLFFILAVPVVNLVSMLPVTFSGIGLREGAWVVLLAPFAVGSGEAVGLGLLFFGVFAAVGAVGGILFGVRGTSLGTSPYAARSEAVRLGMMPSGSGFPAPEENEVVSHR